MTIPFSKGRYVARFAQGADDVLACQRLRHLSFFGTAGVDADRFDDLCRHLMVADRAGRLVATVRFLPMASGAGVGGGYAARFYDLSALAAAQAPMAEIGRFCVAPDVMDADVLRVAWGALTRMVDDAGIAMLFGCTSFAGIDPTPYIPAFEVLQARYLGPEALRPAVKAAQVVRFADLPRGAPGLRQMPPLLRTYLAMGGWVSDHAVVDRDMNTLHVFTCVTVAAVPAARARALRAVAR
ncbi:GNAT family N-acetyltransferase [Yoonia sp.]|jgi:putative hemolysin|uniref:GNAT family N-acetyltransferase n=1 Tax=Yoonia sp. TaxID=2212373 RepID=UPI0025F569A6|nr:GNAT family N-acetyltransferase [Yoonia sp.]